MPITAAHTDFTTLTEENPNPILRVTRDGQLIYANHASKILINHWHTKIGNQIPADWRHIIIDSYKKQKSRYEELEINDKIFSLQVVPIKNSGYVNIYAQDVTVQRHSDIMKSEFVSLASHQLRSPLTAVRWLTERLQQADTGPLNDAQKEIARLLRATSLRLIHLVNDLLNISRLESGRIIVEPTPTQIHEFINQILTELKMLIEQKQHTIKLQISRQVPYTLLIDPQLFHEVLTNLLTNAIKYTPDQGTIEISAKRQAKSILFSVSDSGFGIPKEEHSKIFNRFYRATNVAAKDIDGTGLGLYLVKLLLEASGGKIWFNSDLDKGTKFYFTIPRKGTRARRGEVKLTA